VEIDRDNFNDVLASIGPRLAFPVDDKLSKGGGSLNTELRFKSIEDFSPVNIVKQVPALRKLFEARGKLSDLLAKLDGNDDLDGQLQKIVNDTDALKKLKSEGAPVNA
jgi:type VI secretion system protein ImpB